MSKVNRNLIYDVGMHKGEDTAFYLKKGFSVIAFEADPDLIASCKERFQEKIKEDKLIIVEGAIVNDNVSTKTIKFYQNQNNSVWNTVVEDWSARNETFGTPSSIISVPTVNFKKCIEKFGMPHYMKIDIEGMDLVCLETLSHFENKPNYISIESEKVNFSNLIKEFKLLERLGYNKFKVINQGDVPKQKEPLKSEEGQTLNYVFEPGSSGLFGNDFEGSWISKRMAILKYRFIFFGYKLFGDHSKIKKWRIIKLFKRVMVKLLRTESVPGWYDTHAIHSSYNKLP